MKKYIVAGFLTLAVLVSVGFATPTFAQTTDVAAQIQALLAQIKVLQAQIAQLQGSTGALSCNSFTDLSYGNFDTEPGGRVSQLQEWLGIPSNTFGFGTYGPKTRNLWNSKCGTALTIPSTTYTTPTPTPIQQIVKDPVITSVGSPANPASSFYPGDRVTIVGSNLPANASVYIGSTAVQAQSNASGYNTTFYAPTTLTPGTYYLYVVGKATQSNTVQVTVMAKPVNQGQPYINYISPTSVPADGKTTVTIVGSNLDSTSVYMVGKAADLDVPPGSITYNAYGNSISFVIPVGTTATTYDVVVRGKASESNKASLTITSPQTQNYKPTITMVRGKASDDFEAYAGEDLSIEGTYLAGNYIITTNVHLGGIKATVKQAGDNLLWIVTPDLSSGTYDLTVSNEKGTSNPVKVTVRGKQTLTPTVSYAQAPAEYQNILHMNQRATVYGSNFSGTVYIKLVGKAQDYRVQAYNVYNGSADFIVPTVASTGDFDIYVEQSGVTSNSVKVQIVN